MPSVRRAALAGFLPRRLGGNLRMLTARRPDLPRVLVYGIAPTDWPDLVLAYPEYDLVFARRSAGEVDLDLSGPFDAVFLGPRVSRYFHSLVKEGQLQTLRLLPSPVPWLPIGPGRRAVGHILDSRGSWMSSRGRSEIDAFLDGADLLSTAASDAVAADWLDRLAIEAAPDGVTLIVPAAPPAGADGERSAERLERVATSLGRPIRRLPAELVDWTPAAQFAAFERELANGVAAVVTDGAPQGFHALLRGLPVHVVDVATSYAMRGLTVDHDLSLRRGRSCSLVDLMTAVLTLSRYVEPGVGLVDPFDPDLRHD